jgi:hypothetical protein
MYCRVNQSEKSLISELQSGFALHPGSFTFAGFYDHFLGKPSIDLLWRQCGAIFLFC